MGGRLADLNRMRQIAQAMVRHGLGGLVDQLGLSDGTLLGTWGSERTAARFGRRLALALEDLGPTFVKLGQILATREDMLPQAMAEELGQLRDKVRALPAQVTRREVETALGRPIEELFASFWDEPVAAGSIAQVHAARSHEGHDLVVKVRRPGIEEVIDADLSVLRSLAETAAARVKDLARHDPVGFVEEFAASLQGELDFRGEAQALDRLRAKVGHLVQVPRYEEQLSCANVLTLEFLRGVKVTDLCNLGERRRAARGLVACFATQYLGSDIFHADPHAGNLMQRPDGMLGLLDFGATGCMTRSMRAAVLRITSAVVRRDSRAVARAFLHLVWEPSGCDREAYERDMGGIVERILSRPLSETTASEVFTQVFQVTRTHALRLRPEYFLLFRSLLLLDGVLRQLDPEMDPIGVTRAYILRSCISPRWALPAARIALGMLSRRLTAPLRRHREARQA